MVAQLLAAAPLASALPAAERADAMPCAEMMGMAVAGAGADTDACPCCPDGMDSLRDCLTTCTLAVLALPDTRIFPRTAVPSLRVNADPSELLHTLSDPPLKPPPIR
ncbi:MAG TPA: hypothetical protein VFS58_07345 [Steroidobacteraceae bacterium]|nr:hypothetical protein [Steroidobacteraceae bacterium]